MNLDRRLPGPIVLMVLEWRDYHIARLRGAQRHLERPVVGLEIFGEPSDPEYYVWHSANRAGVDIRTVLPTSAREVSPLKRARVRAAVCSHLEAVAPALVVVTGYSEFCMRVATRWARNANVPRVLLSSSTALDRPRRAAIETLKGGWLRRHYQAAFTSGSRSAEYLAGLRFPPERIWRGYGVVDNDAFRNGVAAFRSRGGGVATADRRRFLFVGRLAAEKNLPLLLEAYSLYRRRSVTSAWGLTVVGDGPSKSELQHKAAELRLDDVEWSGFRTGSGLYECYARAGALVLPSLSEPWGLVVNEALACGLPVLVSDRCGCVPELVANGETGYVFDAFDASQLANQMVRVSSGAIAPNVLAASAERVLAQHSPDEWGRTLAHCAETLLGKEPSAT